MHSAQLASLLIAHGIKPGSIVILCFSKSKWVAVANLAVLKAGGACASVDPLHPQNRLDNIVADTRACVILTQQEHGDKFAPHDSKVVFVDSSRASNQRPEIRDDDELTTQVRPSDPAFLVFTSGSTGKPKGIVQEHGSYCTSILETASVFASRPERRHLQFAAHTFDNSISDIFVTLYHGGTVCIPAESCRLDPVLLAKSMEDMRVNQAELTPTVARLLQPLDVPTLDTLILTGESATTETISSWYRARHASIAPAARQPEMDDAPVPFRIMNVYGPAETTIMSTVKHHLNPETHPLDVGTALGGRCWIVDPRDPNHLMPPGLVGELVLEGPFVARDYLNDPERTREVFFENLAWTYRVAPLLASRSQSPEPTIGRLYRTRDLARYNQDGSIRLVGRNDTHIKLRGQRVEMSGIEHSLCASEVSGGVRHGAVFFPETGVCEKTLVAILTLHAVPDEHNDDMDDIVLAPQDHAELIKQQISELQAALAEALPAFMVPSTWIVLTRFPLQTSGKLDRKRMKSWLEQLDEYLLKEARSLYIADTGSSSSVDDDMTAEEAVIVGACQSVLNIPGNAIRLEDSFLRLGGKSFLHFFIRSHAY